ncbi:MAG: MOFRL family protein, partial [Nitrososphaera sp.]
SDAIKIVRKYCAAPDSDAVVKYLARGVKGVEQETPKPGDPLFSRVHNILVGNNILACKTAANYLRGQGLQTVYLGSRFDGEAKDFGAFLGHLASDLCLKSPLPFAVVLGGETTVRLGGNRTGTGGRNQEAALACAIQMKELPLAILTMGTDGIDGNSEAAGAVVSNKTLINAKRRGLDLPRFLLYHDSYHAFKILKSSIITGRTGTNVNDIAVICRAC